MERKSWGQRFKFIIHHSSLIIFLLFVRDVAAQDNQPYVIQPGDTWSALAYRTGMSAADLRAAYGHMNRQREPVIGMTVQLPVGAGQLGVLARTGDGGLLATAVANNRSAWQIAQGNGLSSPYRPTFYQPLILRGGDQPPRDLPVGYTHLELSHIPARPGQALGLRGQTTTPITSMAWLDLAEWDVFGNGRYQIGLTGTGAFYGKGQPELAILPKNEMRNAKIPLWTQPYLFVDDNVWNYQQLTLTGSAAEIDQAAIDAERARLFEIWGQATAVPQWTDAFRQPITNYLEISATYGDRRSYNGGPYRTYHEGVDFSAYGGTEVYATAVGTVVVAESLFVRGGAVIIDHGLGVYTGVYHLSEVIAQAGQTVQPGDLIGRVGTTGFSTGNHLHWDLLVNSTWVDALSWQEQNMACWILEGLGQSCEQ